MQPTANHNGGHLAFGPDGYLYIGLGDGGTFNDPHGAQDPTTLLGKMVRIDVSVPDNPKGYQIPPPTRLSTAIQYGAPLRSGRSACAIPGGTASTIPRTAEPVPSSWVTSDKDPGRRSTTSRRTGVAGITGGAIARARTTVSPRSRPPISR